MTPHELRREVLQRIHLWCGALLAADDGLADSETVAAALTDMHQVLGDARIAEPCTPFLREWLSGLTAEHLAAIMTQRRRPLSIEELRERLTSPRLARSPEDVQRAHDQLVAVVLGDVDLGFDEIEVRAAVANLDVLCWLLGHEHNQTFTHNLELLREQLADRGITERRTAFPINPALGAMTEAPQDDASKPPRIEVSEPRRVEDADR